MYGIKEDETTSEVIVRLYPDAHSVTRDFRSCFNLDKDVPSRIHADQPVCLLLKGDQLSIQRVPRMIQERTYRILHVDVGNRACGHFY